MKSRTGDEVAVRGGWGCRNANTWLQGGNDRLARLLEPFRPSTWPDAVNVHVTHLCPDGRIVGISSIPSRDKVADVLGDTVERWIPDQATRDEYRSALAYARSTKCIQRYEVCEPLTGQPWACVITPMVLDAELIGFLIESRPVDRAVARTGARIIRPQALNI